MPSKSYDLCTCNIWNCNVQQFRRRQESTLFDLDLQVKVTLNVAQCPLHHVTYAPTEFEVTTSKALEGEAFTRNSIFDLDLGFKVTQDVAKYPLHHVNHPATKFEVVRSNRLGGDTFTRKFNIWPLTLTLGSRSHKMLPSTLYIMWPFQLQSLKLLRQKVKEEMQGVKVTQNVSQYPLHHATYLATKCEVATSSRLGGDTFTRKYNIWPLTLTLGSRSHEMLPSTLYIMWPFQLQS